MASRETNPEATRLAQKGPPGGTADAATRRAVQPGSVAAEIALGPLKYGEAPRIGCIGDPGGGKTVAMRYLITEYVRRSVGWAIVVDDKDPGRAQYEGQTFIDVADVGRGMEPEPRIAVLRGNTADGGDVEPDEAARWCWSMKTRRIPTMLVLDEAKHRMLVSFGNWASGIEWMPKTLEKGRSVGIALLWGAQFPQQVPIDFFETTQILFVFKTTGSGLAKLMERGYCTNGVEKVIPQLKGYPLPPPERGEFVVLQRGVPWDGQVYRFPTDAAPPVGL